MSNDPNSEPDRFTFELSLSVLDHLGRHLYRSFATVLGEAISNAWDADATNVWIYIDKEHDSFFIKDDGIGMSKEDFQNKFLKIGYSKRKDGGHKSPKLRPYIGRKGIGKLALLSCADRVTVISKAKGAEYVGGVIDNSGLDKAITDDLSPQEYPLGDWDSGIFAPYSKDHEHGTILYFEKIKEGIRNSLDYLKTLIALYFRFSLLDKEFTITVNGDAVDFTNLESLSQNTQFLWKINSLSDPFIEGLELRPELLESRTIRVARSISGFIASVKKPRQLKIMGTDERVGVDLFVNGRLRERDILSHIPTSQIPENYLYGQIHYDDLDSGSEDRFTSSREGIVADDPEYKRFLEELREEVLLKIVEEWDEWRRKHKHDGDAENPSLSTKERKSEELFFAVVKEFSLPEDSGEKKKVDSWVDSLRTDATFNFASYAECFVSENLIRRLIDERKISLSPTAASDVADYRSRESKAKIKAGLSIEIRKKDSDLSYLSMEGLANLVDIDKGSPKKPSLSRDSDEYKPMRDAVAHTALLSDSAKIRLSSVFENVKARVVKLLS